MNNSSNQPEFGAVGRDKESSPLPLGLHSHQSWTLTQLGSLFRSMMGSGFPWPWNLGSCSQRNTLTRRTQQEPPTELLLGIEPGMKLVAI